MLRFSLRLMLVAGIGLTGVACLDDGYGAPGGYPPPPGYGGYYGAPPRYGYSQPGYTTVTVTNRGQNGYADDVVQQQVPCGSQYYDGYRQRIAWC